MQTLNKTELRNCYYEDTEIQKIMYGDKLVWEGNKVIALGTGQSWNIRTLYPNLYNRLTSANFFFASANSVSELDTINMRASDTSREWGGFTGSITKSYDSSTGILTAYSYIKNTRGNVRMFMCTKPEKLVYLGKGSYFNVSNREDYESFVGDNFLISGADYLSIGAWFYPQGYDYADGGRGTLSVSKSYNASTGVLTCGIYLSSVDTSGVYNWYNWSTSGNLTIYLNPKVIV